MKIISPALAIIEASQPAIHKNRFSVSRTAGTMPVYTPKVQPASFATDGSSLKQDQGFSFKDIIDVINPLQHIPVVSNFYQKITGDKMSAPAHVIGGTLFGGPIGGALALADVAIKKQTGSSVSERILNLVSMDKENKTGVQTTENHMIRKTYTSRTAGTMPTWQGQLSPDNHFATLLNDISSQNNNIS